MMRGLIRRAAVAAGAAVALLVPAAGLVVAGGGAAWAASGDCTGRTTVTCTYTATGAAQTFTVPAGVSSITVTADGAAGGDGFQSGGLGGEATATFPVAPGDPVEVLVGGQGAPQRGSRSGAGGFNGGGAGGPGASAFDPQGIVGAGGGGASDVRTGACAATLSCGLADRVLVAAGGGGAGTLSGGGGGNPSGGAGAGDPDFINATGGGGGSQSGGGTGGTADTEGCSDATDGGTGGATTQDAGGTGGGGGTDLAEISGDGGGGGGGGYWGGGGGGGACLDSAAGGGGGSSFGPSGAAFTNNTHSGDGQVTITYTPLNPPAAATTSTTVLAPASGTAGAAIAAGAISATLAGADSGATGVITYTVFGPQSSAPTDCSSGGSTVGTAAVSGPGTYNSSAGFTAPRAGTYWWSASYSGDDNNLGSASSCGAGMISTGVSAPSTTTMAGNATATFSASSQKVALSASVTSASTVTEGTVTFTVANSSNQTVGQATAAPVSGGSASASYDLPAGLPAGTYTIDASYSDPGGAFAGSSDTTGTLTVGKATPQITWASPAGITWGTPLSGAQLDATAPVPGTFTYTPKADTVLGPGNNQPLSASFTPADTTDYTGATATAAINVVFNPAACITRSVAGPLVIGNGQAYCVHPGAVITNGVTVQPGGALYLTGGAIKGSLRATGAKAITVCGATVSGGVTITGTTGPLSLGTCGTNTITGSVSLTGNTGALTYQNNTVSGSLTITGNTGGAHIGPGNKTTGTVTIKNNT